MFPNSLTYVFQWQQNQSKTSKSAQGESPTKKVDSLEDLCRADIRTEMYFEPILFTELLNYSDGQEGDEAVSKGPLCVALPQGEKPSSPMPIE